MPPYEAITRGIEVQVESAFVPEHSDPQQRRWFYSYRIRISNQSEEKVQLINRFWVITDAEGQVEHVRGAGVVGEQPVLGPGQSFEYTSGCPLGTPFGSMHGIYEMVSERGEHFEVRIPAFVLRQPGTMN